RTLSHPRTLLPGDIAGLLKPFARDFSTFQALERLPEVAFQVLHLLHAEAEPDETSSDAHLCFLLLGQGRMTSRPGPGHHGSDRRHSRAGVEKPEGPREIVVPIHEVFPEVAEEDAAVAQELPAVDPGGMDARDLGPLLEELRHQGRDALVLAHSQSQGLEAPA